MTFKANFLPFLTAGIAAIASLYIIFWLTFFISCLISPPVFIDKITGKEHGLMPFGQAIIGVVFATIGSVLILIFAFRYSRRRLMKNTKNS